MFPFPMDMKAVGSFNVWYSQGVTTHTAITVTFLSPLLFLLTLPLRLLCTLCPGPKNCSQHPSGSKCCKVVYISPNIQKHLYHLFSLPLLIFILCVGHNHCPIQRQVYIHDLLVRLVNLQAPRFLYIGQAFRYYPENAFYIFNLQIYFII